MNGIKEKLLNILLFPVKMFERLTDKKGTLYAGVLMIGIIDLLLPDIAGTYRQLFTGKPLNDIYINASLAVLLILVLGTVDVLFIGLPLFDFFNFLKKKEINFIRQEGEKDGEQINHLLNNPAVTGHNATAIKVMKVYIMSHFIIIPVNTIVYFSFLRKVLVTSPLWMQNLALAYFMIIFIWSAAILTRGINTLFRFNPFLTKLTFIIVFAWNFLFGMVFDMQIINWLTKLFR